VESGIEKPSNNLLALTDLDSNTWVSEVKRIRGKKQPLSSAGLHALRDEYTRTIEPARALAAEALVLERTLSDRVNQAYALTPAEIALIAGSEQFMLTVWLWGLTISAGSANWEAGWHES